MPNEVGAPNAILRDGAAALRDADKSITRESLAAELRAAMGDVLPTPDEQYAIAREARMNAAKALESVLLEIELQEAQGTERTAESMQQLLARAWNLEAVVRRIDARLVALREQGAADRRR